jgi:hypothetical protein
MDSRWARRLTALYPSAWRARYGDEFAAFLEEEPSTLRAIVSVVTSAIRERVGRADVASAVPAVQLILILPATLFLSSVVVRDIPVFYSGAQWVVMLYVGKVWTLWLLLLLLPLLVVVTGCLTLLRVWKEHHDVATPQLCSPPVVHRPATRRVAAMTVLSAGILATVVLHMLAS